MICLDSSIVIRLWEEGKHLDPLRRAILMLSVAAPDGVSDPESLSIGRRDAWLYRIRVQNFGRRFEAFARCPSCRVELEYDVSEEVARVFSDEGIPAAPTVDVLLQDGRPVTVRSPATSDLLKVLAEPRETAKRSILAACVQSAEVDVGELVDESDDIAVIEDALLRADPAAEVLHTLSCPECSHSWTAVFEMSTFLWQDIERSAIDLLESVHLIASRYAWSEAAILEMSSSRRQFYLSRITS